MKAPVSIVAACWYCGGCPEETDHQVPVSRGGTDDPSNLVDSCTTCNSAKSNRLVEEFRIRIAAINNMKMDDVRFHGEGGRTFKFVRVRDRSRIDVDSKLKDRVNVVASIIGSGLAARLLHLSNESLASVASGLPTPPSAIDCAKRYIHAAEEFTAVFRMDMDDILQALDGIERSVAVIDAIESFREAAARLHWDARRFQTETRHPIFADPERSRRFLDATKAAEYEGALRALIDAIGDREAAEGPDSPVSIVNAFERYRQALHMARSLVRPREPGDPFA